MMFLQLNTQLLVIKEHAIFSSWANLIFDDIFNLDTYLQLINFEKSTVCVCHDKYFYFLFDWSGGAMIFLTLTLTYSLSTLKNLNT